jgi:hypothetical protein
VPLNTNKPGNPKVIALNDPKGARYRISAYRTFRHDEG